MRKFAVIFIVLIVSLTGCKSITTQVKELKAMQKETGLVSADATGKFGHADFEREEKDGVATTTINISTAWTPRPAKFVFKEKLPEAK